MSQLYIALGVILISNALLMGWMIWAFHSEKYAPHLLRPKKLPIKAPMWRRVVSFSVSSVLSVVMIGLFTHWASDFLFTEQTSGPSAWVWGVASAVGTVFLYDFLYYFFHRAMHHKRLIRYVHAVHHKALSPSAFESLYVHPAETAGGIFLLLISLSAMSWIAPAHPMSFALTFAFYSTMNIMIHCGIRFPSGPMKVFNAPALSHFKHHLKNPRSNYASLFPIWDMVFGTKV